jgi:AraC family transcriptional regulator, regulatory protein of adaptative response / methylated-DNA-[protein]-cysteine methyltransferase
MVNTQEQVNFERIAEAIEYLSQNFRQHPTLEEVAEKVHLSPFHFQRMFTEWAGVSPKKFVQFLTVDYAKSLLRQPGTTLFDAAFESGLSGTGRLHDLFISIEAMTPGEYKNGGSALAIRYDFATTAFGDILIASTTKGICHIAFADDRTAAVNALKLQFPNAVYEPGSDYAHHEVLKIFRNDWNVPGKIRLHLKGTPFQLKVWQALLTIPMGRVTTYGALARTIDAPKASRAVGTAIGQNPIAFIIPCHRVIQSAGTFGNYHWGPSRKTAMIGWEAARCGLHQI